MPSSGRHPGPRLLDSEVLPHTRRVPRLRCPSSSVGFSESRDCACGGVRWFRSRGESDNTYTTRHVSSLRERRIPYSYPYPRVVFSSFTLLLSYCVFVSVFRDCIDCISNCSAHPFCPRTRRSISPVAAHSGAHHDFSPSHDNHAAGGRHATELN